MFFILTFLFFSSISFAEDFNYVKEQKIDSFVVNKHTEYKLPISYFNLENCYCYFYFKGTNIPDLPIYFEFNGYRMLVKRTGQISSAYNLGNYSSRMMCKVLNSTDKDVAFPSMSFKIFKHKTVSISGLKTLPVKDNKLPITFSIDKQTNDEVFLFVNNRKYILSEEDVKNGIYNLDLDNVIGGKIHDLSMKVIYNNLLLEEQIFKLSKPVGKPDKFYLLNSNKFDTLREKDNVIFYFSKDIKKVEVDGKYSYKIDKDKLIFTLDNKDLKTLNLKFKVFDNDNLSLNINKNYKIVGGFGIMDFDFTFVTDWVTALLTQLTASSKLIVAAGLGLLGIIIGAFFLIGLGKKAVKKSK